MRTRLFGILVAALCVSPLAGCGDDSAAQDLAAVHDMAVASGDNCNQLIACAATCAGASACQNACAAKGSTKAQGQFTALFGCAYGHCTVASDGGTAACTSTADTGPDCQTCVAISAQAPGCKSQLMACTTGN